MDLDLVVLRETLRHGIARQVKCSQSGVILDVRKAVMVTLQSNTVKPTSTVYDGVAWDKYEPKLRETIDGMNAADSALNIEFTEVIDGRVIHGKRVGAQSDMTADAAQDAIVNAKDTYAARVVCASLPMPTLLVLADLLHMEVPTSPNRATLIDRIVRDAR